MKMTNDDKIAKLNQTEKPELYLLPGDATDQEIDDLVSEIDKEHHLTPHTNAGRLYTTVRRMKAEKERGIPINRRSGFAISVETGHAANQMGEQEWESFYSDMAEELKRDYPDMYARLFPEGHAAGKKAARTPKKSKST